MDKSTGNRDDQIKRRAFELWQQHGSREGYQDEFWAQAERELKGEGNTIGTTANADRATRIQKDYPLLNDDVLVGFSNPHVQNRSSPGTSLTPGAAGGCGLRVPPLQPIAPEYLVLVHRPTDKLKETIITRHWLETKNPDFERR
jgi:hypothetical protein